MLDKLPELKKLEELNFLTIYFKVLNMTFKFQIQHMTCNMKIKSKSKLTLESKHETSIN